MIRSLAVPESPQAPEIAAAWAMLDDAERAEAAKFVHDGARCQHLIGRSLAKNMLGEVAGVEPASIRFRRDEGGKPHVESPAAAMLPFNLSHTRGMAVCAVLKQTDRSVGVDVERIDRRTDLALAGRYFAIEENRQLDAEADEDARRELFFRFWTLKEAFVKATGTGLRTPLDSFAFDAKTCRLIRNDAGPLAGVEAQVFATGETFRVAVVVNER